MCDAQNREGEERDGERGGERARRQYRRQACLRCISTSSITLRRKVIDCEMRAEQSRAGLSTEQ